MRRRSHRHRRDDRDRPDAAGTAHPDDRRHRGDQHHRDAGHRDAGHPDAEPADGGCCRASGWGAAPCPGRWRRDCYRDEARRGAAPCPARWRRGCYRDAVRHRDAAVPGWCRPGWGLREPRCHRRPEPLRREPQEPAPRGPPERQRRALPGPRGSEQRERGSLPRVRERGPAPGQTRRDAQVPGGRRGAEPTQPRGPSRPAWRCLLPPGQREAYEPPEVRWSTKGS